ncbi:hypothetical protein Ade02nite_14250 [Paractinoplanes deccanensis]|uniref:Gustatory receptor n=1 Tax=Paractinoplanes deccanensis TaxID=113561 RepID=A0ABQ3XYG0_9ACTN|nr:hypothetical protein [Actinoplanes deccanensis]GID72784.1 hypothetical protein Ade02nite_14250 [Actinoplanes deccanensis]
MSDVYQRLWEAGNVHRHLRRAGLDTAVLTLVGFAAGCGIARVGSGATASSRDFAASAEFAIWSAMVGFEVALRVNVFGALWSIRTEVRRRAGVGFVWPALVALVIVAVIFHITERIYPLPDSGLEAEDRRRFVLQLMMLVTIAPGLVTFWRIRSWIARAGSQCALRQPHSPPAGQLICDVLYISRIVQKVVVMISAVIVVSILEFAAFRTAFMAQAPSSTNFPVGLVILYGVLLTVVLSFLYFPVYSGFNDYKRQLRDALCPVPAVDVPDERWHAARDRTERLLQLPRGPWESVRSNYAILAPLFASVFSLFLPGVKF